MLVATHKGVDVWTQFLLIVIFKPIYLLVFILYRENNLNNLKKIFLGCATVQSSDVEHGGRRLSQSDPRVAELS